MTDISTEDCCAVCGAENAARLVLDLEAEHYALVEQFRALPTNAEAARTSVRDQMRAVDTRRTEARNDLLHLALHCVEYDDLYNISVMTHELIGSMMRLASVELAVDEDDHAAFEAIMDRADEYVWALANEALGFITIDAHLIGRTIENRQGARYKVIGLDRRKYAVNDRLSSAMLVALDEDGDEDYSNLVWLESLPVEYFQIVVSP